MEKQAEAILPTDWGQFKIIAYSDSKTENMPHIAMVYKEVDVNKPVLLRVHSECMTGDLFKSNRCDCGEQLDLAMKTAAKHNGVVIYLRQEGRGIGLINKLKAYNLQDTGMNTVDANVHLGFEPDERQYDTAVQILQDLGISSIELMTNNPAKIEALEKSPIKVIKRLPIIIEPKDENKGYMQTKQDIMGHLYKLKA